MRSNDSSALSRRCRARQQRAAAVGLSAATLILAAACSSGGTSAGGGSASTSLPPRQALLAAATQAQQVTSASEALTVNVSGASSSTVTGTIQIRLKPTPLASEDLQMTAAGTSTRIKMILTSGAIYFSEASLTSQLGKPWIKTDLSGLSALAGTSGASLAQLFRSLQSNNFTSQAQLFTVARNTRVVGTQLVDGVTTTDYAGSFTAADGLKALPAGFRQALAPELQALGTSTIYFREWVDGQHHLRKVTEVETVNGDTVNTTINITAINQAVHITLPPANQTFTLASSGPGSGNSFNGDLGAKVVPAPAGFALSQDPNERSGPMNAAGFNTYMGSGDLAAGLHFAGGYDVFYDSPDGDIIEVTLFQFATPNDATLFQTGWVPGGPVNSKADPFIPGAEDFDSTTVDQDSADHGVIAIKGNMAFVIDDVTSSTAPVPLVETMARQQYAALLAGAVGWKRARPEGTGLSAPREGP
jgi:hypothetical protein